MTLRIDAPVRRGTTFVTPERRLAWSEWGAEDRRPVLLSPGHGLSSRLGFAHDALESLGVCLIGLDRPGLGRSDPAPERTLATFAEDVRVLCAERGLGAPPMVGFSLGAASALACAAAGVVAAVSFVSGTDELALPELGDRLPADLQGLVRGAARAPEAVERQFATTMTAAGLRQMIFHWSPEVDLAVYRQPAFLAAFEAALEEGFAQGAVGCARDSLLSFSPWPFDPASIDVPVDLWYGAADTSPVHSPDFGATLARRIPGARRTVVDGAGGAVLWTHGAAILERLLERAHNG